MMTKQGWKEGQSLGNRDSAHLGLNDVDRLAAARVGILFKDDNLGLGAKKKSKDIEGQRTGLDAFQGLLGRLNGKSDAELQEAEKKVEDRKLEMYAKGRWGGLVFVKGGILVGSIKEREQVEAEPKNTPDTDQKDGSDAVQEQKRKEEKKQRKEERRKRKEEKAARKTSKKARKSAAEEEDSEDISSTQPPSVHRSPTTQPPDEAVSSASSDNEVEHASTAAARLKRKRSSDSPSVARASNTQVVATTKTRNGRHLLRGRNIEAKRMAFSDIKGLDEIFMRPG